MLRSLVVVRSFMSTYTVFSHDFYSYLPTYILYHIGGFIVLFFFLMALLNPGFVSFLFGSVPFSSLYYHSLSNDGHCHVFASRFYECWLLPKIIIPTTNKLNLVFK